MLIATAEGSISEHLTVRKCKSSCPVGCSDDEQGRPRLDRCEDWASALEAMRVTADSSASDPWNSPPIRSVAGRIYALGVGRISPRTSARTSTGARSFQPKCGCERRRCGRRRTCGRGSSHATPRMRSASAHAAVAATRAPRRGPPRHHPVGCSAPGLRIILSTSAMCCSSRVICSRAYSSSHTLLSTTSASRL